MYIPVRNHLMRLQQRVKHLLEHQDEDVSGKVLGLEDSLNDILKVLDVVLAYEKPEEYVKLMRENADIAE